MHGELTKRDLLVVVVVFAVGYSWTSPTNLATRFDSFFGVSRFHKASPVLSHVSTQ